MISARSEMTKVEGLWKKSKPQISYFHVVLWRAGKKCTEIHVARTARAIIKNAMSLVPHVKYAKVYVIVLHLFSLIGLGTPSTVVLVVARAA